MPNQRDPNKGLLGTWIKKDKIKNVDLKAEQYNLKRSEFVEKAIDIALELTEEELELTIKLIEERKKKNEKKH